MWKHKNFINLQLCAGPIPYEVIVNGTTFSIQRLSDSGLTGENTWNYNASINTDAYSISGNTVVWNDGTILQYNGVDVLPTDDIIGIEGNPGIYTTRSATPTLTFKHFYDAGTIGSGTVKFRHYSQQEPGPEFVQIPVTKTANNYSKISGLNKSKVYTVFWENEQDVPEAKFIIRYQNGSWTNVESQTEDSATFYVNSGSYWTSWRNGAVYEADKELTVDDFWSPTTGYTTLTNSFTQTMAYWLCMVEGTLITLADGTKKPIEQITYDDELLVWNFYDGKFDTAKPCWIKIPQVAHEYNLCKFSNGVEVGFVGEGGNKGYHRIYNDEAKCFTHTGVTETPIGTTTFAEDMSMPTLVGQEVVKKEVKYYNIITDKHYNLFANGILTSCKLSNKYAIENMKYVGKQLITDEEEQAYFERIENIKR